MAQIRGFLVGVENHIYEERTVDDDIHAYYAMLNCSCIDIVARKLGIAGDYFYEFICDDEGTFKAAPIISAKEAEQRNQKRIDECTAVKARKEPLQSGSKNTDCNSGKYGKRQ